MLKELFSELESRRTNREVEFWTTAQKIAAGEKVAAATVERLLAESGKTPAELKASVELIQQRRQWHAIISAEPALEKERAAIKDRIAAEDRKLAAAEQAHADATGPMYARLDFIKARVGDASDARRKLIQTCPDTELKAELEDVLEALNELREKAAALRERAALLKRAESDEEEARIHEAGVSAATDPRKATYWRDQAARNRYAGEKAAAVLPDVLKQIATLECQEASVYERMLKP